MQAEVAHINSNKLFSYFPDDGALRRELYQQHLRFFELGKEFKTRCFMAANRVGKTEGAGGYECTLHLTGLYPDWWPGRRFDKGIDMWAAGDTSETVRDIIQFKLFGPHDAIGTGLIPKANIISVKYKPNGKGLIDSASIKNTRGSYSRIAFKTYEQGRISFQGTEKDVIWLDEESDVGIRAECAMRLMTTDGILIETFTPLKGLTQLVMSYIGGDDIEDGDVDISVLEDEGRVYKNQDRAIVMAGWNDVPHLEEEAKRRMRRESEPHLVEARSTGRPSLGAGAIYPVKESEITCEPFLVPEYWPIVYGLDVGWNKTAAIWGAHDRDSDIVYLWSEHCQEKQPPSVHADAIRSRAHWIPGVVDPASNKDRDQNDGKTVFDMYSSLGLDLDMANNAVDAGLNEVLQRMVSGRLKIFKTLYKTLAEYRTYHRNEQGKVVKKNDHLMDALRYLVMSGLQRARCAPIEFHKAVRTTGRNPRTGY